MTPTRTIPARELRTGHVIVSAGSYKGRRKVSNTFFRERTCAVVADGPVPILPVDSLVEIEDPRLESEVAG